MALVPQNQNGRADHYQFVYFAAMLFMFALIHRLSQCQSLRWFPEASLQMLAGLLVTLLIIYFTGFRNSFNADLFFLILLPPIMFNSGLDINIKYFYQNFMVIMVFANIGTIINALIVGGICYQFGESGLSESISVNEAYSFGALISATDPVTTIAVFDSLRVEPHLYTIVVGVSILDDAVAVILFDLFSKYSNGEANASIVFEAIGHFIAKLFVSMGLGYLFGILFAHYLKVNPQLIRRIPLYLGTVVTFVYCSYLVGEVTTLSGIITTMFAAIALRKYYELWSPDDFSILKNSVNGWSYVFESMVFFNIGLTLVRHRPHGKRDYQFIGWSLFACFVGRVSQIYPLAFLLNWYNSRPVVVSNSNNNSSSRSHTTKSSASKSIINSNSNVNNTAVGDEEEGMNSVDMKANEDSTDDNSHVAAESLDTPNSSLGDITGMNSSHNGYHLAATTTNNNTETNNSHEIPTNGTGEIIAHTGTDISEQKIDPSTCYIPPPKPFSISHRQLFRKRGVLLSWGYQHMILFAGLRGPIAYATARLISKDSIHRGMFIAATNFTVAVTTFVLGALTVPALHWFDIKYGDAVVEWEKQQAENLEVIERLVVAGSDDASDDSDSNHFHGNNNEHYTHQPDDDVHSRDGQHQVELEAQSSASTTNAVIGHELYGKRSHKCDYVSLKNSWLALYGVLRWNLTTDEWLEICRHYEYELVTRHFVPIDTTHPSSAFTPGEEEVSIPPAQEELLVTRSSNKNSTNSVPSEGIAMVPIPAAAKHSHASHKISSSSNNVNNSNNKSKSGGSSTQVTVSPPVSEAAKKRLAAMNPSSAGAAVPPTKPAREGLITKVALDAFVRQQKQAEDKQQIEEKDNDVSKTTKVGQESESEGKPIQTEKGEKKNSFKIEKATDTLVPSAENETFADEKVVPKNTSHSSSNNNVTVPILISPPPARTSNLAKPHRPSEINNSSTSSST